MSNQLITTSASNVGLRVGSNVSTADVNVMPVQSSGALRLGVSASRSGGILIGNPSASGFLTIDSGSGGLNLLGTGTTNVATGGSRSNPLNLGNATDTGDINVNSGSGDLNLLSTAATNIATGGSRTGVITIGDASDSANIAINAGSETLDLSGDTGIRLLSTGAIAVGSTTRGTAMTIGTDSDTADITIDAGSAAVNVRGSNGLLADDGISFDSGTTVLSNYASATFTPTITGATGSMTLGTVVAQYVRIGALVHASAEIPWTAVGTATGDLKVEGLPIAAASVDVKVPIVIEGLSLTEVGATAVGHIASGSTNLLLEYVQNNSAVTGNIAIGDMEATGTLHFSFTYHV